MHESAARREIEERRARHVAEPRAGGGVPVGLETDESVVVEFRIGAIDGEQAEIAFEADQLVRSELPDTPLDFTKAVEGLSGLAMPEAPLRACQSQLHLGPHGMVEMREANEALAELRGMHQLLEGSQLKKAAS